jgi:phage replication-related protein YjqB (UPF0714/DUF867 family)
MAAHPASVAKRHVSPWNGYRRIMSAEFVIPESSALAQVTARGYGYPVALAGRPTIIRRWYVGAIDRVFFALLETWMIRAGFNVELCQRSIETRQ